MFLPFYVIEVEIKPQTGDVQYRSEDGGCYQRMHGSTSNVDHCMEEAEGVKVGQSNSVKLLNIAMYCSPSWSVTGVEMWGTGPGSARRPSERARTRSPSATSVWVGGCVPGYCRTSLCLCLLS